jgi:SOS-response transcriptional repressor LexA
VKDSERILRIRQLLSAPIEASKQALSVKQEKLYLAIAAQIKETGFAPSVRELARTLELSISSIQSGLAILEKKGWIYIEPKVHRGIRLSGTRSASEAANLLKQIEDIVFMEVGDEEDF